MINTDQNINELLRQKFQNFEPMPPVHIWEAIEENLDAKIGFFAGNNKYYATTFLLLALFAIGYFGFNYSSNTRVASNLNNQETLYQDNFIAEDKNITETTKPLIEKVPDNNKPEIIEQAAVSEKELIEPIIVADKSRNTMFAPQEKEATEDLGLFKLKEGFAELSDNAIIGYLNSLSIANIYSFSYGKIYSTYNGDLKIPSKEKKTAKGHWENTVFISPEFSLSKPDSVTILNSYSIGVEPSRFFNKHLFVRFGLNISFTGDRGFAKIDYISNDMMGTYEDVYDVTFDTINDVITPIYHTKTVEVWDSIRHIVVSEVTNRYLFAQIPVMIGYKNKVGKLHWYVFGGPAIGFQITKWIDKTNIDAKDIDIIDFNNRLPLRSTINYQIWVGAGIEYKLSRNYSIVIEPLFKHYFNSLYSHDNYKNNTSGFALRIGFNYKIGN